MVMDRAKFNEALTSLVEYAAANANHVSKKDIAIYFQDILTEESMYDAVYAYLKESKIVIDDIETTEEVAEEAPVTPSKVVESEEELAFIEMYKNDMANIVPISDAEKKSLITKVTSGDSMAMATLTEAYLPLVHEIALTYQGKGLTLGDLIQEGNIGLMLAIPEFTGHAQEFDSFVRGKIEEAIDEAINMQISSERISSHLADRMNRLDDISRELTEKLGHAPSIEELANEMNLSEDEVETIIRTSLNVLTVSAEETEE